MSGKQPRPDYAQFVLHSVGLSLLLLRLRVLVFSMDLGTQYEMENHIEDQINYLDDCDEADANPEVECASHRPQ